MSEHHPYLAAWYRTEKAFGPFVEGSLVPDLTKPCKACRRPVYEHREMSLMLTPQEASVALTTQETNGEK